MCAFEEDLHSEFLKVAWNIWHLKASNLDFLRSTVSSWFYVCFLCRESYNAAESLFGGVSVMQVCGCGINYFR